MGKYTQLATDILEKVGGSDNTAGLTHCITRLRFKLKDETIAKTDEIKNMDGVITVMQAGGQYQVVIGNHVPKVFEEVMRIGNLNFDDSEAIKMKPFDVLIDAISGCFQPFLAILAAGGMIRGFTALFVFLGLIDANSGTFFLLDNMGDSVFFFMPIIIGLTAARKFKVNEFVGLLLGAMLMNPNIFNHLSGQMLGDDAIPIMTLFQGTIFESPIYYTVFGLPFIVRNYASSVIPIIFVVLLASQIQKPIKKIIPEMIANFFVPFFTLLITMPLGFLIIGPLFTFATDILMSGFQTLIAFNPVIYGLVLGFFWQFLVMFGLHWAVVPMGIMQFTMHGFNYILAPASSATYAQTAAVIAIYLKLKNPKDKAIALPAIISGIVGITEPAIYGFTLPRKKVFIFTCIGAGVAGAFAGLVSLTSWNQGGLGIFGIPNWIRPDGDITDLINGLITLVIAISISFALTWFFHKEPETEVKEVQQITPTAGKNIKIMAPIVGKVQALSEVEDAAFSQGLLGNGVAIEPTVGKVVAPADGVLTTLFPTKHAIGLTTNDGVEILIHIGMDTVQLDGKHFTAKIAQGDQVKKGQVLVEFDIEAIKAEGYSLVTPIIITNTQDYADIVETDQKIVSTDDTLINVLA